jgi:HEAT repeat protein
VTHGELAPLLNEVGALGNKAQRSAALKALARIAANDASLKMNPLVESRVWLNRFAEEGVVTDLADSCWEVLKGSKEAGPSPLFAVPLTALLSNAAMQVPASKALSAACSSHPGAIATTYDNLKKTYLQQYPAEFDVGGGKEKKDKKKKPSKAELAAQFMAPPGSKGGAGGESKDKDDEAKKLLRRGVQLTFAQLGENADVVLDADVQRSFMHFLVKYALCDGDDGVRGVVIDAGRKTVKQHGKGGDVLGSLLSLFEQVLESGKAVEGAGEGEPKVGAGASEARARAKRAREKEVGAPLPRATRRSAALPPSFPPLTPFTSLRQPLTTVWASDFRKEGAVILLGSCALHLTNEDPKITSIFNMLLTALSTPSESVQSSVAQTIIPLMKKGDTPGRAEEIVDNLMKMCLTDDNLGRRRGAAYGLSACVKGLGIASLKKYEIVTRLEEACGEGSKLGKEGALFAVELLCARLGLLFEPYVIVLLPALLKCFGDSSDFVREAAGGTAGLIMSKLSAHGVKLVMPSVLSAFDEDNWRTKQASIRMLGSMSSLAPKQLASCLPKIVPKLSEAFSDTHPKVKASAESALNKITQVIRNPEVAGLTPILLKALTDPAGHTKAALQSLLETEFLHAIDAPSLALLIPILYRGLKDKAGTSKRHSALIVGNMVTMINDAKDFSPYIDSLIPGLKGVLLDPIPDVRSTASKCVGALVRGLGTSELGELRPWLLETLKVEGGSAVERSGAAQGLSEYLVACGGDIVFNSMREEILPLVKHPAAGTREGVLWVLSFLPNTLGGGYSQLIDSALPALLGGLADEQESVREVALRAGRVMIRSCGKKDCDKILPALEAGMVDRLWRIRNSSVGLLGDLLAGLGGTTVAGVSEVGGEDDTRGAEKAQAAISLVLGSEARKRVLSRLYMARCDSSSVVRQSSTQVWKTVVNVTPRTLREILPVLIAQVVDSLGSGNADRTQVAGRCLGDVVKKLGEAVLPEVIPILRDALYSGDAHTKRGVCVGLQEIIEEASKEQISKFLDTLVSAVRDALCDEDEEVRKMAAGCFQRLFATVGTEVLDSIVPSLVVSLDDEDSRSLLGLGEILRVRSKELLPYLLPLCVGEKHLVNGGVSVKNAAILKVLIESCSTTVHYHLGTIINPLVNGLSALWDVQEDDVEGVEQKDAIVDVVQTLCRTIDTVGINWLVGTEFVKRCASDKPDIRRIGVWLLGVFATERKEAADFSDELPVMLREVVARLNDADEGVLDANAKALKAVCSSVAPEEIVTHLEFTRNNINSMVSEARRKKGGVGDGAFTMAQFNKKGGLEPLLPMYHQGILYGGQTLRETAARGLGELIDMTNSKFLATPVVVKVSCMAADAPLPPPSLSNSFLLASVARFSAWARSSASSETATRPASRRPSSPPCT